VILLLGASGQVGRALSRELSAFARVTAPTSVELDLTSTDAIRDAVRTTRPLLIVNAAAYTAVDAAESDSARAFAVNAGGAGAVAAATFARRLPLIHVSTDYVFSGGHPLPYREDDVPDPRTAYGRSKLAGEAAIAAANPDHAILRTAWLYSPHGSNFVKTMLRLAGTRDTITVVDDQVGNPTYAPDLAEAILVVAARMRDAPDEPRLRGVFHLTAPDSATWFDFAREIMQLSADLGGPAARIVPIGTADYPTAAERPRNSRLDCGKIRDAFGIELPHRALSLAKCVRQLLGA
jgi:dTDP-4-dehydrorhamnose reductase